MNRMMDEMDHLPSGSINYHETGGKQSNRSYICSIQEPEYHSTVIAGLNLIPFVESVKNQKKRECYKELHNYVYGPANDKVMILYGLRGTGKRTLIRQLIGEMDQKMLVRTAFIQVDQSIDLKKMNQDLKQLSSIGYQYIFVDEVTLMNDFIEGAALFSDVYATRGMKIILSGTDSLGFVFSEDRELYDRCQMIHTTFVPYREFEEVLEIKGIDTYIQYGGTMSRSGVPYQNAVVTFATEKRTNEYVDVAIASNIQHSLKNYQYGNHFRALSQLYQADELTSAIQRIVEDMNHRFTIEVLTRDFVSSDLSLSAKNLLQIRNQSEQTVEITDDHRKEIKEYLDLLDLTVDIDVLYMNETKTDSRTVISQPGLRYSQAESLVRSLLNDSTFHELSKVEKNRVIERILNDVKGRMMEDIVLLESKVARADQSVFKLMFDVGEFDMVVCDEKNATCEIYEIKHSTEINENQIRHLIDQRKCEQTEHQYGTITGKYVLYRGEETTFHGVRYLNVESYLKSLGSKFQNSYI